MILSAGLTPAWQQILVFDGFRYGEVNRVGEVRWCASGKVFNAGIAAHHLGGPSRTLAPVGGPPREQIERELDELRLSYRWITTASATRVCTTIIDRAGGTITELVENGRPLAPSELETFCRAYAEECAKAATIAWATRDGRSMIDCVKLGIAAAGQNLRQLLPCRLDPARIEESAKKVRVGQR